MRDAVAIIRGPQIRAARAMLRLTSQELADLAGVSRDMIKRAEKDAPVPRLQMGGLATIKRVLEQQGIVFIPDKDDTLCGIALRKGWNPRQKD